MPVSSFDTKVFAVSEYRLSLKGIAAFRGKLLVLDADGLHVLDAADDNGAAIVCRLASGYIDAADGGRGRSVDAWVEGEGVFSVGAEDTDGNAYRYAATPAAGTRNHKAQLGRGLKESRLKFSVEGTPFTFYRLRLRLGILSGARKV